tara:strand:- start:1613 stop:1861 length:249 start_codon:yes stop_codon:yes gene_type:complete
MYINSFRELLEKKVVWVVGQVFISSSNHPILSLPLANGFVVPTATSFPSKLNAMLIKTTHKEISTPMQIAMNFPPVCSTIHL